ncbi:MAG: imidazolonepropionase [Candidatus Kariarchaeaceae archaeon]|jgi:imidazolonepropionase
MGLEISGISGYFDGVNWHDGPYTFTIDQDSITSIRKETLSDPDINANGGFLSPPFVDGHTHLIFAGDRSFELPLKVGGASYAEILEKGGGILHTVDFTREATDEELLQLTMQRLDNMMIHGTHVVEAKSGYGLNAEEELRQLNILSEANKLHPVEIVSTYCGAHALPRDKRREDYVEEVISILPEIKKKNLATTTDVFCDRGAYTIEETRKIFQASLSEGIAVRAHAEELEYTGIGKIAASEYNALSVDHLLLAKQDDFRVYQENNCTAMFMPAATIGLFTNTYPQGWQNLDVNIGLGSDYNPNNLVISMQTAARLAVYLYKMSPAKAFQASISGSYRGVTGRDFTLLRQGSEATFNLFEVEDIPNLITQFDRNLVSEIMIKGKIRTRE